MSPPPSDEVAGGAIDEVAQAALGSSFALTSRYVDILASRGVDWGLLGPRERDRLWERHILNSVALRGLVPDGVDVADIGSGAGLPGIPLALARPDLQLTLVEPLLRRATFLEGVVAELELSDRVQVLRARAEDVEIRFDVVTARALAPLPRLLQWCVDLVRPAGQILALKGRSAPAEVAEAQPHLRRRGLTADVLTVRAAAETESTYVVRVAVPAR